MPDREKVIKELKRCVLVTTKEYGKPEYVEIPYELYKDAIELLKEQEELLHKKEKDIDKLCVEISRLKHQIHDNEPTFDDWTKGEGR